MTIVVKPIADVAVVKNAEDSAINLFSNFDDPLTTGLVARFELFDTSLAGGLARVLLFDQPGRGAPLTVQNFRKYASDGDYVNTIIHRSEPGFVVQGGGFTANPTSIGIVPTDPPVKNEFSTERSNLRGTIAMAKLGSSPDSATSQWFFNLANNSANLDNQNGGFTVFGQLLGQTDLAVADAIAALPKFNGTSINSAFTDLPLILDDPTKPVVNGPENFVRFRNITVSKVDELRFSVVSNSNPGMVSAAIANNQLVLDYQPNQSGTAEIIVRATNLLGETIDDRFSITVADSNSSRGTAKNDQLQGGSGDDVIRALGGKDSILGQDGNDRLIGGGGNDKLNGDNGDDSLKGNGGRDRLGGSAGSDTLNGGGGNDKLSGGDGDDVLDGKGGIDVFQGGSGNDIFRLKKGPGRDIVKDFENGDRLFVKGASFNALTISKQGRDTLISIGNDELVLLNRVKASSINAADFV